MPEEIGFVKLLHNVSSVHMLYKPAFYYPASTCDIVKGCEALKYKKNYKKLNNKETIKKK